MTDHQAEAEADNAGHGAEEDTGTAPDQATGPDQDTGPDQSTDESSDTDPDQATDEASGTDPATESDQGAGGAGDDGVGSPVGDKLEALEKDIDAVRQRVGEAVVSDDRSFIVEGEADDDQPVDDAIAPPG